MKTKTLTRLCLSLTLLASSALAQTIKLQSIPVSSDALPSYFVLGHTGGVTRLIPVHWLILTNDTRTLSLGNLTSGFAGAADTAALIDNSPWSTIKYPDGGDGIEYAFRVTTVSGTFDLVMHTNGSLSISGVYSGDGSGLTNLNLGTLTNVAPITIHGKVTLQSNVVVSALNFVTNQAAVTTLNLGNNYQYVSTNNNIAYTGFTGILAGETNAQWCTVIVTNTSGALKTVTLTGVIGDATVYVTNQSVFTVMRYPLAGTNVVGRSLN